jgi:hypothetical protein
MPDDICEPDRLAVQMAFLRSRPVWPLPAAGRDCSVIEKPVVVRQLQGPEIVRAFLLFGNALIHPTVMFRRSLLEKYHLRYDPPLAVRRITSYGQGSPMRRLWTIWIVSCSISASTAPM